MRGRCVPFVLLVAPVAPAQQAEPRFELYGLSGFYSAGIRWAPFQPHAGAGVLVPLGRDWAILVDATVDTRQPDLIELYTDSYRREFCERNSGAVDDDLRLRRYAALRPLLAWMLRQNRFSAWTRPTSNSSARSAASSPSPPASPSAGSANTSATASPRPYSKSSRWQGVGMSSPPAAHSPELDPDHRSTARDPLHTQARQLAQHYGN